MKSLAIIVLKEELLKEELQSMYPRIYKTCSAALLFVCGLIKFAFGAYALSIGRYEFL